MTPYRIFLLCAFISCICITYVFAVYTTSDLPVIFDQLFRIGLQAFIWHQELKHWSALHPLKHQCFERSSMLQHLWPFLRTGLPTADGPCTTSLQKSFIQGTLLYPVSATSLRSLPLQSVLRESSSGRTWLNWINQISPPCMLPLYDQNSGGAWKSFMPHSSPAKIELVVDIRWSVSTPKAVWFCYTSRKPLLFAVEWVHFWAKVLGEEICILMLCY